MFYPRILYLYEYEACFMMNILKIPLFPFKTPVMGKCIKESSVALKYFCTNFLRHLYNFLHCNFVELLCSRYLNMRYNEYKANITLVQICNIYSV